MVTETHIKEKKWVTILSLALSALGILYFLIQALGLAGVWLFTMLGSQAGAIESVSSGLLVWSSLLSAGLLAPVLLLSLYALQGKEIPTWLDTSQPMVGRVALGAISVWSVALLLGWLVVGSPNVATFLLGPLNLLVAGIPVLAIYTASQRKLKAGSQMRKWRIFGFSLTVMPVVVILVELLVILVIALLVGLYLRYQMSVDPTLARDLQYILNRISLGGDMDMVTEMLEPYLRQPVVIFLVLVVFAGVMPMVEELLKPLALWALAGRKLTAQEGFVGGLLCGAGFALMENVLYFTAAITPEDWLFAAIGRAGTGVLHMLGSGLVGWGLAKTWGQGKWLFLGLTTIAAILFHGLWNGLALAAGFVPILVLDTDPTLGQTLLFHIPLIALLVLAAVALLLISKKLRKEQSIIEAQPVLVGAPTNAEQA